MTAAQSFTTVEKVKLTAPELVADVSDDSIELLIEDAHVLVVADFPEHIYVNGTDIGAAIREQAERYLTLHFLSMDTAQRRGIQSEQVDVIKVTYFGADRDKDWFLGSDWGVLYWNLWIKYGTGEEFAFAVVQH